MNERVQELAKQAELKVESWMTNPTKPFQILGSTEQFEKFAELIVQECVWQVVKDGQVPQNIQTLIGARIKERFGLEE